MLIPYLGSKMKIVFFAKKIFQIRKTINAVNSVEISHVKNACTKHVNSRLLPFSIMEMLETLAL
jgi:hypothetical protein